MPAGDDTQVVHAGSAQDLIEPELPEHQIRSGLHHVLPLRGSDQNLAQAGLPLEPEPAVHGRLSEVRVHHQDPPSILRDRDRQVDDRRGLSLAESGAGEGQAFDRPVYAGELKVDLQ